MKRQTDENRSPHPRLDSRHDRHEIDHDESQTPSQVANENVANRFLLFYNQSDKSPDLETRQINASDSFSFFLSSFHWSSFAKKAPHRRLLPSFVVNRGAYARPQTVHPGASRDFRGLAQGIMGRAKNKLKLPLCLCATTTENPRSAWVEGRSPEAAILLVSTKKRDSSCQNTLASAEMFIHALKGCPGNTATFVVPRVLSRGRERTLGTKETLFPRMFPGLREQATFLAEANCFRN